MLLCPIHAVKRCLSRTEQYCLECCHLFIPASERKKRILKKNLVLVMRSHKEAHKTDLDLDCKAMKIKAHKVN